MKIYLAHSTAFDYENLLYAPLRKSALWGKREFILPHIAVAKPNKSKELIRSGCDFVIAEVSYPSTDMGIELGWADIYNIPVLCLQVMGSYLDILHLPNLYVGCRMSRHDPESNSLTA